jgi:hypothetical protein
MVSSLEAEAPDRELEAWFARQSYEDALMINGQEPTTVPPEPRPFDALSRY